MKKYQYEKPIEMPRGSHYGSDYWVVYSKKLDRRVQCYSMLEFANFLQIEMSHGPEQPLQGLVIEIKPGDHEIRFVFPQQGSGKDEVDEGAMIAQDDGGSFRCADLVGGLNAYTAEPIVKAESSVQHAQHKAVGFSNSIPVFCFQSDATTFSIICGLLYIFSTESASFFALKAKSAGNEKPAAPGAAGDCEAF